MDNFRLLIEQHMDVVFFTYGLAFFALGLAILVQPKEESRYEISQLAGWLASFGLVHGTLEWLSLWKIIHGDSAVLSLLNIVFLLVSYVFLFEFGRRLTRSILDKIPSIPNLVKRMLGAPIYGVVALAFLFELLTVPDRMLAMTVATRYFLGCIGSFLTGIGFLLSINKKSSMYIEKSVFSWSTKYFVLATAAFFFYGVLSCFVAYPANIVSGSVFNDQWFLEKFHFPVQIFRAASAVLAAIAIGNILRLFHMEVREKLLSSLKSAKEAEAKLRISAHAFDVQEGILITDANNVIVRVNRAFTHITGYTTEDVMDKNPRILSSGRQNTSFYAAMWESINSNGAWKGEVWNQKKNGEYYLEDLTVSAVKDTHANVTHYVGILTDITMNRAAAEKIEHQAFYDTLTDLPNRLMLRDRLTPALALSQRNNHNGALLFIDLDNFKTLNDTLGHDIGDLLLQQVAERLVACVREGDTVARLGGDEFVIMLEDLSEHANEAIVQIEVIGNKVLGVFSQSFKLTTHNYHCTPSIGITLFKGQNLTIDELLKQADIAMYQAKASGRNAMCFFDPQMQTNITNRVALEKDLKLALAENQFMLYYQPQVLHNQKIIGAEALIRWHHPQRGLVPPVDFIPLAEETGLILPIGQWVLETACAQIKSWEDNEHTRHLQIAVNVSARQFHQTDFVEQVSHILSHNDINPANLKLELTESLVLGDINNTILKMRKLREIGIRFSMDDFGTGYSSLSSLKKLPINQLKIDQSFIRDITSDPDDAIIVQTIIAMATSLGMEVIAEGVETEEQRAFLELHGCPAIQGYLFGRPMPIEQFEALLMKG
ncbi:EAL domain-containing protein [Methylobacter sp.]